jgi:O-antigen/teichoic acid export membrane protein
MDSNTLTDTSEDTSSKSTSTKKHIRGSSMLFLGRLISLTLNFGGQVLMVRYLSKSDYGAFAYALNIVSMGSSISLFSFDKALSRYLPIYEENDEYPSLFGAMVLTLFSIIGIGLALALLLFATQALLQGKVINDPLAVTLLLILIFLAPLQALDFWFLSIFAAFASVKSIFFRQYILGPGLKLLTLTIVIAAQADVYYLAWGYLFGGLLGILAYALMLKSVLRSRGLSPLFDIKTMRLPFRDIFGFSSPLMYSDVVFILRNNLTVMLLEFFHNTAKVAEFRSVVPAARLNQVVLESFNFLYTPIAARLYARDETESINELYWQTAIWISTLSFPVFIVTFSLAKPITILLFGSRYANSGNILALLTLGYYFNAVLGFNAHTLRVYGKIKYIVVIDFIAMCIAVVLNLTLIPAYDALGAALSASGTLIMHNILNHLGLLFGTSIKLFDWKYLRTYVMIIVGAGSMLVFQSLVEPPIFVSLPIAALISLAILAANYAILDVENTFPELLKIPGVKTLLGYLG